MTDDPSGSLNRLRNRIETADVLDEADRAALLAFSDRLNVLRAEYSGNRREKLHRHCTITAGLPREIPVEELPDSRLVEILEDEVERGNPLAWINDRYDNPDPNRDCRIPLRMFGRHVTDGDEIPWIFRGDSNDNLAERTADARSRRYARLARRRPRRHPQLRPGARRRRRRTVD